MTIFARKPRMRVVLALICVVSLATTGFVVVLSAGASSPQLTMRTVSAQTLTTAGYSLLPPNRAPLVNEQAAVHTVQRMFLGVQIQEVLLASVRNDGIGNLGGSDHLVWVMSLMPSGGVWYEAGDIIHVRFFLGFVDALTGKFLVAGGGGPVQQQPRGCCVRNGGGYSGPGTQTTRSGVPTLSQSALARLSHNFAPAR